jgi:hypothetical protein
VLDRVALLLVGSNQARFVHAVAAHVASILLTDLESEGSLRIPLHLLQLRLSVGLGVLLRTGSPYRLRFRPPGEDNRFLRVLVSLVLAVEAEPVLESLVVGELDVGAASGAPADVRNPKLERGVVNFRDEVGRGGELLDAILDVCESERVSKR